MGTVLSAPARARTPSLISARRAEIKGGVLVRARACRKVHLQIRPFEAGISLTLNLIVNTLQLGVVTPPVQVRTVHV